MSGFFGVASKEDCVTELFYGVDYHSHLGTRRGGMAVYNEESGFSRAIQTLKMHRSVQNLTKMQMKCMETWVSAVFQTMNRSHSLSSPI